MLQSVYRAVESASAQPRAILVCEGYAWTNNYSPDGRLLAVGTLSGTGGARLFYAATGRLRVSCDFFGLCRRLVSVDRRKDRGASLGEKKLDLVVEGIYERRRFPYPICLERLDSLVRLNHALGATVGIVAVLMKR